MLWSLAEQSMIVFGRDRQLPLPVHFCKCTLSVQYSLEYRKLCTCTWIRASERRNRHSQGSIGYLVVWILQNVNFVSATRTNSIVYVALQTACKNPTSIPMFYFTNVATNEMKFGSLWTTLSVCPTLEIIIRNTQKSTPTIFVGKLDC